MFYIMGRGASCFELISVATRHERHQQPVRLSRRHSAFAVRTQQTAFIHILYFMRRGGHALLSEQMQGGWTVGEE